MEIFAERINKLKELGGRAGINAFLITTKENMRYFTGLSVLSIERFATAIIPVENGNPIIIVPKLEEEKAKTQTVLNDIRSYSDSENPAVLLKKAIKELRLENAVFGVEATLPFKFYKMLMDVSPKIQAKDASAFFSQLRSIKSDEELQLIRRAADIVAAGIRAGIESIKPGVSELAISSRIEQTIKEQGGEYVPFCIVLSGENTALPHGETSLRKVSVKDVVLMDVGAVYNGYYADLTRTVFVGEATTKQREIYKIVAKAQEAAIQAVKPNVKAEEIDYAARKIIEDAGYGEYFTHRTGHGLGLEVHEEPYIVKGNKTLLKPGMTFTVEPGIYLPGKFGVRIEDDIAVTEKSRKILSTLEKEMMVV
ncbi:MAG: Xaa-Pro peptidase family protein [Candidatus Bathyarchaeia archaeon]